MTSNYTPKYLGMETKRKNRIESFIRSYDLLKADADALLQKSRPQDGQPRGNQPGDPVAAAAIQRENILKDIKAIDDAIERIPEEYRQVVWEWVKEGTPLYMCHGSEYAAIRTWQRYRRLFLVYTAQNKGWWIE